jgi:3-phenylpropionate/trans-cinnamate dioxygenase alpha subunit
MALDLGQHNEFVSVERGEIDRRIFSDPEIFERELELIFGRAWNFVAHESQIPKAGDFFAVPIGRDNVLVVRQRDGSIKAFLNTCTHRGNAVCRAEEGNTKNFMCTYHGWTFALDGALIGVPGFENLYHSELDKSALGLREVAQLDTYGGFVFATLDETAPPLVEFLGATGRIAIDIFNASGDLTVVPGIQKYVINCNWKFAVDNLFDYYHPQITHMSALEPGVLFPPPENPPQTPADQLLDSGGAMKDDGSELRIPNLGTKGNSLASIAVLGEYGHAIGGPEYNDVMAETLAAFSHQNWRRDPKSKEKVGELGVRLVGHPNLFPNTWLTENAQISLRVPISPDSTEIWWFSFIDKNATEEQRKMTVDLQNHVFGPAGFLEQEDGENWAQSTMQTTGFVSSRIPQALKMNLGRGIVQRQEGLSFVESSTTEHAQLWTYRAWAQYMSGADWETIKANTQAPDVV